MRSYAAKGLFGFLAGLILLSTVLGYEGIGRLRRTQYPPFEAEGNMFTAGYLVNPPEGHFVLFLDSMEGRLLVWCLVAAIPIVCGTLAFRNNFLVTGFAVLFSWAALFGWIGFRIFLHAMLDAVALN
jgi:hypothetical protein